MQHFVYFTQMTSIISNSAKFGFFLFSDKQHSIFQVSIYHHFLDKQKLKNTVNKALTICIKSWCTYDVYFQFWKYQKN